MSRKLGSIHRSDSAYRKLGNGYRKPPNVSVKRDSQGVNWLPRFNKRPFANYSHQILKYCSEVKSLAAAVSGGGVVGAVDRYALNGLYDPDITATGHQPMGFDQLTAIWSRYKVWKVEIKVTFIGVSGVAFGIVQINPSQAVGTYGAGSTLMKANERANTAAILINSNDSSQLFKTLTISEIEGNNLYTASYEGGSAGNPGNVVSVSVGCGDAAGTDTANCQYFIEIVYHAKFFNRVTLAQS